MPLKLSEILNNNINIAEGRQCVLKELVFFPMSD